MNPNTYEYSYGLIWSYIHGEFVLFLEDDRPFRLGIERFIIYPNYIEEATLLLKKINELKGILFKEYPTTATKTLNITTSLGQHILKVILKPPHDYFFTNGPAIYRVSDLLKTGNYISENNIAKYFKANRWYTGFTYKRLSCKETIIIKDEIYSSTCQGVSYHFDSSSTRYSNRKVCKISLY